jgi:Flp pilus assembly protein TadG
MVEFGQYFLAKNTLQAAARDGARAAIITSATQAQAQQAVATTASSAGYASGTYTVAFLDPTSGTAITNIANVTKGSGIKVTVSAQFSALAGRPLLIIPSDKQVVASTTMVKE